jgi:hypothetical protein
MRAYKDGNSYKLPIKVNRIYYKYENWTQPVLTSDNMAVEGGYIVSSASSCYSNNTLAYKIMTGKTVTTVDTGYWQTAKSTAEEWVQIQFPYKLNIAGLSIYTRPKDNVSATVTAYTDSSKTTKIGNSVTTSSAVTKYTFLSGGDGVLTDTIYLHIGARNTLNYYYGLQNLQITAQKLVEGSVSDFVNYEDKVIYYGIGG